MDSGRTVHVVTWSIEISRVVAVIGKIDSTEHESLSTFCALSLSKA
jgi:hypothetical protein